MNNKKNCSVCDYLFTINDKISHVGDYVVCDCCEGTIDDVEAKVKEKKDLYRVNKMLNTGKGSANDRMIDLLINF